MDGYLVFVLLAVVVHASQSDQIDGSHNTGNEQECTNRLLSVDLLVGIGYGVLIVLAVGVAAAVFLYVIYHCRKRSKAEKTKQQRHDNLLIFRDGFADHYSGASGNQQSV